MAENLSIIYRQIRLLSQEQQNELLAQIKVMMDATEREITQCPFYGVEHNFVRNGHKDKKQRYKCKSCNRNFTERTGTELSYSQSDDAVWFEVISDTISGIPLRRTAARLDLTLDKTFRMRHTILSVIERYTEESGVKLDGIVEVDDTYFLKSVKGMTIESGYYRDPRLHGAEINVPGVSNERVSVNVGVARAGDSYAKAVNTGKPSKRDVMTVFSHKLDEGAMVYCDGDKSFLKVFQDIASVERVEKFDKRINISTVNNFHKTIKDLIDIDYAGVATKYLNRYSAMVSLTYRRSGQLDELVDFVANLMFAPKFKRVRQTDMPWNDILDLGQFEGLMKMDKHGNVFRIIDIMNERQAIIAARVK